MAANFKLEDILKKTISSKEAKEHIKAKGRVAASKEEGVCTFLSINNYKFSDGEEGLLIYIDKSSLVDKAFKTLKKEAAYVKHLFQGEIEADDTTKVLNFTKTEGKGKSNLAAKLAKKNAWIKQAAYTCNIVLVTEEESEEETEVEEVQTPTTSTIDTPSVASNKEALNTAATALKNKWDMLSVAYLELQKDKANKGLAMRAKSLIQDFINTHDVAPALVKQSLAKVYNNVQTMASNLNVNLGAAATAAQAGTSPEKTKAIEVNTKIKTAIDTLLKDINLEAIYQEAKA